MAEIIDIEYCELKPCPFCGGKPILIQQSKKTLWIRCSKCMMGLKQSVVIKSIDWLRMELIKDWNKRK